VAVNCAALPESLAVAELFGHAEGAYTGARRGGAEGRIAQADGGTLMLDEIGDMPLSLQVTLLRFLDNFRIRPLGQSRERQVDVQIVAATHVDLREAVRHGRFRHDLLYRLNTVEVPIPPLRERQDFDAIVRAAWAAIPDAPPLVDAALHRLAQHRWEGNMRELKGVLHRLAFRHPGQTIDAERVARELPPPPMSNRPPAPPPVRTVRAVTDDLLQEQLHACDGNVSEAARRLGMSRSTLYRYMARRVVAH
jgi:transcriptional regulator of acetoin/glycerol metabolism